MHRCIFYYFNINKDILYIYVSIYHICWFEWLAPLSPFVVGQQQQQQQKALGFDGSARHWPDLRVLEMNLLRPENAQGVSGVDPTPVLGGRIKECRISLKKTIMQLCRLVIQWPHVVTSYIYCNEGIQSASQRMIGVCNHLRTRSRDREKVDFMVAWYIHTRPLNVMYIYVYIYI